MYILSIVFMSLLVSNATLYFLYLQTYAYYERKAKGDGIIQLCKSYTESRKYVISAVSD